MVCITRLPDCGDCLLRFRCAYPVLFQPFAPPELAERGRYGRMPVPFVLKVPFGSAWRPRRQAGEVLEFEIVLLGEVNLYLPYYVLAFAKLGRAGLGPSRHRLRLQEVAAWTEAGFVPIYEGDEPVLRTDVHPTPLHQLLNNPRLTLGDRLTIRFTSPVRLDLGGDLVYPVQFDHLVRALVHRSRALASCYGGEPQQVRLEDAQRARQVADRTRWVDLRRYSTRQQTDMRIGGVVGTVTYEGIDFSPFSHLLSFGEWLGVGKLTSMGLGQMEVVRA